jgi:hypothetical protein
MLVSICMACTLYKLVCAYQCLHCSKLLGNILCQLKWLDGNAMVEIMATFKDFYNLSLIHDTIVATQINLQKPKGESFALLFIEVERVQYLDANCNGSLKVILGHLCWYSRS